MVQKLFKFFHREVTNINQAALVLGFFTLMSQVLGLVRDRVFASQIGVGLELDIYNTAFRIPDLIFAVAASLVSVAVLIPFFVEQLDKGQKEAKEFVNNIFTAFSILMIAIAVIVWIAMPMLAPMIAPGFDDAAQRELINMSRIMLLSPIFLGISNLFGTITQAYRNFIAFSLTPVVYNAGIIIGALALYPVMGLWGLAIGVVIGAVFHMSIQIPAILRHGMLPRFTFPVNWNEIWRVVKISFPRTIALSFSQVVLLVMFALATKISEGSVSIYRFAFNLQSVPLALIGLSFSQAAFPTLVKVFTEKNMDEFRRYIVEPARQIIFWSIPVIVLFVVLRAHIVRVILGAGEFTWADTRLTAATLAMFVISIVAQSLIHLLVRGYYAAGKTKRPLLVNAIGAAGSIAFSFLFLALFKNVPAIQALVEQALRIQDVPGTAIVVLAFAFSCGTLLNFIALWVLFRREFLGGGHLGVGRTFIQTLIASLAMGVVTYQLLRIFDNIFDINTFGGLLAQAVFAGGIGIIVALVILILFKNQELHHIIQAIRSRMWSKASIVTEGDGL